MQNVQLRTRGTSVLQALNTLATVTINGNLVVEGDFANPSDRRIKENIAPLAAALPLLLQLNPVTYHKTTTKTDEVGLIAQEVEEVLPGLVGTRPVGDIEDFKELKLTGLIPYLVKAVQELSAKCDAQAEEIAQLKGASNES